MKLSSILARKGSTVWKIAPECTAQEAILQLSEHHVRALVVEAGDGTFLGIVTERDILVDCGFECCQRDKAAHPFAAACPRQVRDIMTSELVTATPDDTLQHAMSLMTAHRVRHLPVLQERKLVGILSIGDLVHAHLNRTALENRTLGDFVRGRAL